MMTYVAVRHDSRYGKVFVIEATDMNEARQKLINAVKPDSACKGSEYDIVVVFEGGVRCEYRLERATIIN